MRKLIEAYTIYSQKAILFIIMHEQSPTHTIFIPLN